jgi:tRNA(fMet)-specific endonuclease VapC
MAYLLDTDWVLQMMANQPVATATVRRLRAVPIAVSYVSVAEIYEGAFNSSNPPGRLVIYRHFLGPFSILNLNDGIAEQFAETRAFLRRRGLRIPDLDLMIAATALHHDLTVLTFNVRHFQRIPDLKLYQATECHRRIITARESGRDRRRARAGPSASHGSRRCR